MSIDILTAAVPAGEQLPGGCWDFAAGTNGGFWASADNTTIPDLKANSWVNVSFVRHGNTATNAFVWAMYLNSSNMVYLARTSSDTFNLRWYCGSTTPRIDISISANIVYSCHCPIICWRNGNEFGIGMYAGGGTSALTFTSATATLSAGDTFESTLRSQSGARFRIGHYDGTTAAFKFNGAIGLVMFAMAGDGEALADYNLTTDTQRQQLLLDPQRIFSYHNFATSQINAYGNWQNSSGVAKTALTRTQFAAGDRNACPFSGKYLTLGAGSAQATELACPPYTMPATPDPIIAWRGSGTYLDCPTFIENPNGGWITYRTQIDHSNNPAIFLDFIGANGLLNRWPVPVPWAYWFVDSSAGNVQNVQWNLLTTSTNHNGDTHTACPMMLTDAGLLCAPYLHSNSYGDRPDTGDRAFEYEQLVLFTDEALPETIETYTDAPWGTAFSQQAEYLAGLKTYSLMYNDGGYTVIVSRSKSAASAEILLTDFKHSDKSVRRKVLLDFDAVLRNYPGPLVRMSDGRRIEICHALKADGGGIIVYSAIICPPLADLTDNTKYFSPTGVKLDGTAGLPAVGAIDQLNYDALHITSDNAAFFDALPLPALAADMHSVRMETPIHVNGAFEGIAAIVRKGTANGDLGTLTTNTSGTANQPYDETTLRRWTYTGGATPTLVFRDSFDLTTILDTLNPGTWPQDTSDAFATSDCQFLHAVQYGGNRMLLFIVDPETVEIGTNKSMLASICGFTIKAALFYQLDAADPTEYVEFVDVVFDIATDNSEGYAAMPYFVGNGNDGSKSVAIHIAGGDWWSTGSWGNRLVQCVDLRTSLRTSLAANDMLPRPRSTELLGL